MKKRIGHKLAQVSDHYRRGPEDIFTQETWQAIMRDVMRYILLRIRQSHGE